MTRSVWKGPFVDGYLLKKAEAARGVGPQRGDQDLEPPLDHPAAVRRADVRRPQRPQAHSGAACPRKWSATSSASSRRRAPSTATRRPTRRSAQAGGRAKADEQESARARARRERGAGGRPHAPGQPAEAQPGRAADPRQEGRDARWPISNSRASASPRTCASACSRRSPTPRTTTTSTSTISSSPRRYVGKALVHEALLAARPRPRRPHREAVLRPHHRGA